jgi:NAD(P)-dependent dehydrogenase (short-subunit alcohol dehydrogenase family)/acyl carrier protein
LIQSNGTKVTILQSDSADKSSVSEMIDQVKSLGGPIRGVIHAAGVISDGTFDEIDEKRINKSYGPKLEGAHYLVDILEDNDDLSSLDFILFTSSISSVVGLSIQGTYASANSGLDGLAEELTKRGINACAIQLGAVDDNDGSGMASDESVQRYLSTIGLHFVTPRQLNGVLDMAVLTSKPHFTAGEVDWLRNSRAEPANSTSSVLKEIVANSSTGSGQAELENLMLLDHSDRTEVLTDTLLGLLTDALGVEDENLNAESNFASMGIDSLSIMEVQAGINSILQQDLPLSRMFTQDGTVGQLAGRISTYLEENESSTEDAA